MPKPELYDILSSWTTRKYVVLQVDVSSTHDDADLADIATHYPSGDAFSWDEFNGIIFITDIKLPINEFELKYNSTDNDAEPFTAAGQTVEHTGVDGEPITSIYFSNNDTDPSNNVIIKLEGF